MALPPIYDPEAVAPMWQELAAVGVEPLTTPEQVDLLLGTRSGSALVIVNSVCGCAAGQECVLRWVPGGRLETTVGGVAKRPIADEAFADAVFAIWLAR